MKKLLVVVDYQNDFVTGSLGFPGAEKIEEKIISLIKEFENNGDDIIFTLDLHDENYKNTVEGRNLPIDHCMKNTWGFELTDGLKPYQKNYPTFAKPAFGSFDLGLYIKDHDYDEILLCGLVSDICVFSNAIIAKSASSPECRIAVYKDATSSYDLETQEKAFEILRHLHIGVI